MMHLSAVILVWGLTLWLLFRSVAEPSTSRWARAIAFRPEETIAPEQLFGCLLSGNLAVMTRDNFNQLGSGLTCWRARKVLERLWGISSPQDCRRFLEHRLQRLGQMTRPEKAAVAAWLSSSQADSREYRALRNTCVFLSSHMSPSVARIRNIHIGVLAWNIQQLAYMLRLSLTAGYAPRTAVEETLTFLAARARSRYASWRDYSLAGLIGLGMRGSVDTFDRTEWLFFARTHAVLLHELHSPTRNASSWLDVSEPEIGATPVLV